MVPVSAKGLGISQAYRLSKNDSKVIGGLEISRISLGYVLTISGFGNSVGLFLVFGYLIQRKCDSLFSGPPPMN